MRRASPLQPLAIGLVIELVIELSSCAHLPFLNSVFTFLRELGAASPFEYRYVTNCYLQTVAKRRCNPVSTR